jgi:hypothetical protein
MESQGMWSYPAVIASVACSLCYVCSERRDWCKAITRMRNNCAHPFVYYTYDWCESCFLHADSSYTRNYTVRTEDVMVVAVGSTLVRGIVLLTDVSEEHTTSISRPKNRCNVGNYLPDKASHLQEL